MISATTSPGSAPPVVLTIAGVDPTGGAGIAADLSTFAAVGVHGTCAVTALTAQNTTGVTALSPTPSEMLDAQIASVVEDFPVVAVKTGYLGEELLIRAVIRWAGAGLLPELVVDPVLVAADGRRLLSPGAVEAYRELIGHARIVTPNLPEAAILLDVELDSVDAVEAHGAALAALTPGVVAVTGGHLTGDAVDIIVDTGTVESISAPRVATGNVHGSGCTFAAATTAYLALGLDPPAAIRGAKAFVHHQLTVSAAWELGSGAGGPVAHTFPED